MSSLPTENQSSRINRFLYTHGSSSLGNLLAILSVTWVIVDVVTNNWELNDYIGNGQTFFTPVLGVSSNKDLMDGDFAFPRHASPISVSNVGQFMLNYTLSAIYARDGRHYVLTAGSYLISDPIDDICGNLIDTYALPKNMTTVRLGTIQDRIMYVRGTALSNIFSGVSASAPEGTNHSVLSSIGYVPSRIDCDTRLTMPIPLPKPDIMTTANVSMYRYYSCSFCTGCSPVIELSLDVCLIDYSYNATSNSIKVFSSHANYGQYHRLGLMIERTSVSKSSFYLRVFCVIFVLIGYTTSQKTVRWMDGASLTTWLKKIIYMVSPSLYRYRSSTYTISSFCFNSDIFVLVYLISVLLDEKSCAIYSRSMYRWNSGKGSDIWITWRLLSMSFRLLWFNCFMVKCIKWAVNFFSMTRYNGSNFIVGFFNFSSVTYVYIGSVVLMLRNDFIEYGNADNIALYSTTQLLDGISVSLFDSWFIRAYPGLAFTLLVNLVGALCIDHLVNYSWWKLVRQNSLGRQNMYNSTSILCDLGYKFIQMEGYNGQAVASPTRSLCTIQWFLTCHTLRFGLPEHPKRIRAMAAKCLGEKERKKSSVSDIARRRPTIQERNNEMNQSVDVTSEVVVEMYMFAQDHEGNIHLYNAKKHEIQALSMEVKILADANYIIA